MIALCLTTPRRREFIPPDELPVDLNQLEKHYDAADQQRAIVEHKRLRDRGNQDWWLIVDLVLVIVVLFLVNRWLRGI